MPADASNAKQLPILSVPLYIDLHFYCLVTMNDQFQYYEYMCRHFMIYCHFPDVRTELEAACLTSDASAKSHAFETLLLAPAHSRSR